MKTKFCSVILMLILSIVAESTFAQCKEVKWPESPELRAKAEEKKVLYEDALKANQPAQAKGPFDWLLKNAPGFHGSLYIYGAELYDKLVSAEKDPARKKALVDTLMYIYDERIKHCGEEGPVTNRKAMSFIKHQANEDPAKSLELLDKALELNGENTMDGTLVPYMQLVRLNKLKLKTLTDEQVLSKYDNLTKVIDSKLKKAQGDEKQTAKLNEYKSEIDKILVGIVKIDCDFVKKNLEPKYRTNPKDLGLAKMIFAFMLQGKCTDDPLWLETGEAILKDSAGVRDCGLAKNLGIKYLSQENFAKAEELLREAQTICTTNADKGEVMIYLGTLEARKGNKAAARELYRKAASADASVAKQANEKIGDLYFNSFNDCAQKVNQADDRLVYLIAADYYQKAGDSRKVAMAKEAFPSKEDIFLINYKVGDSKTVGCWINESTTIRTRD